MRRAFYTPAALISALLISTAILGVPAAAFRYLELGERIPNVELLDRKGVSRNWLRRGGAGVFAFIRPGQEYSAELVTVLQGIRKRRQEESISWTLLVSESAIQEHLADLPGDLELGLNVLVDRGDALYGELGVTLHPVVGIVDGEHRLRAYIPYRRVHLGATIEAYLAHTVGEITDEELTVALSPSKLEGGDARAKALRHLRMAEMMLDKGNSQGALAAADRGLGVDPTLREAHALRARAFALEGDCERAREALVELGELTAWSAVIDEVERLCAS